MIFQKDKQKAANEDHYHGHDHEHDHDAEEEGGHAHTHGIVEAITDVMVRWLGHRLHAEVNMTVNSTLSVESGHAIAKEFRHELLHHLKYLSDATIHVDPATESGTDHHHVAEHSHKGLPPHSH